jgi:hypothetical protein
LASSSHHENEEDGFEKLMKEEITQDQIEMPL